MRSRIRVFWAAVLMAAALVGIGPTSIAGAADAQAKQGGLWPAGEVGRWTGYVKEGGSQRVREVQRRLRDLGLRPGPVDGLFGPRTEAATKRLQRRAGLEADGIVGRRTLRRLRAGAARERRPVSREERSSTERPAPRVDRDGPSFRDPVPAAPAPSVAAPEPSAGSDAGLLRWTVALFVAAALLAGAALLATPPDRRRRADDADADVRDHALGAGGAAPPARSPETRQPPAPSPAEHRDGRFVRHDRVVTAVARQLPVPAPARPRSVRRDQVMTAVPWGVDGIRRTAAAANARRRSLADELAALSTLVRVPKHGRTREGVDPRSGWTG